jgi:hypothetical protein
MKRSASKIHQRSIVAIELIAPAGLDGVTQIVLIKTNKGASCFAGCTVLARLGLRNPCLCDFGLRP